MPEAETATLVENERRRVLIGQMADSDFVDLCRKVHESAMTTIRKNALPDYDPLTNDPPLPCSICGVPTTLDTLCMPCVRIATKVILETADWFGNREITWMRTGK